MSSGAGRLAQPQLIVLSGEHKGDVIVLDDPLPVVFGSRAGVQLPEPALAEVHCQVFRARGRWFLQDFATPTGTWIGDVRVEGIRPLEFGKTFRIGDTHVAFLLPDPESPADHATVASELQLLSPDPDASDDLDEATDVIDLETPLPAPEAGALVEHDQVGEYDILGALGASSLGAVYKGYDRKRRRVVAIKVLDAGLSKDSQHVARFLRGAKAGGRLTHPHIVKVLGAGHAHGKIYVTMEYVEGQNLEAFCAASGGTLMPRVGLGIVARIVDALGYAHTKKVVHRNVTPENILIGAGGYPKLADLAQAKRLGSKHDLASSSLIEEAPTSPYAAPESLFGQAKLDARSDVYGVGATLFRALIGAPPYGADPTALRGRVAKGTREPVEPTLNLSPKLVALLERCLSVDPKQRFASMDELRAGIAALPEMR